MPYNPKSLANLKPWTSESAPRHPRKGGGWSVADYLRFVAGGDHTTEQLRAIADDNSFPHGRRAAAQLMLDTTDDDPKVRGAAFDRVADRLEGRPTQSHRVVDEVQPDPQRVLAEIRANLVGADLVRFEELAAPTGLTLAPVGLDILVEAATTASKPEPVPTDTKWSAEDESASRRADATVRAVRAERKAMIREAVGGPRRESSTPYTGRSSSDVLDHDRKTN